ncbi:hypothetical protein JYU20_00745 [Bacteroidales bacterium AH-315-I05]|nr:hypothetical protein [Bacteroidales bacterium AH-315-I05]
MNKVEHTIFRNQELFCLNCRTDLALVFPLSINEFSKKIEEFNDLHKDCGPTRKQPEVDQSKITEEKIQFWLTDGEIGISSKTMFETFCGETLHGGPHRGHPIDPDDFRRCYLLLETIPEWKKDLHKLKGLSPVWSKLVDNWDKLTEMLKEQLKTKEANGMYEFMKKLGC